MPDPTMGAGSHQPKSLAVHARELRDLRENGGLSPSDPMGVQTTPDETDTGSQPTDGNLFTNTVRSIGRGLGSAWNETTGFIASPFTDENPVEVGLPDAPEGFGYGLVETATQFAAGFVGAGKVIKPLRLATRGAKAARGLGAGHKVAKAAKGVHSGAAGAIADFTVFDPYEDRLADLMENAGPEFAQPVAAFLASDEEDHELLARAKASMEGMLLGGTIAGLMGGIRAIRVKRKLGRGKLTDEEAAKKLEEINEEIDEIIDNQPATVKETDEGFKVEVENEGDVTFETSAQAERFAASWNHSDTLRNRPTKLDDEQAGKVVETVRERLEKGADPDVPGTYQGLGLNLNHMEGWAGFKASSKSLIDTAEQTFDDLKTGARRTHKEIHEEAKKIAPYLDAERALELAAEIGGSLRKAPGTLRAVQMNLIQHGEAIAQAARRAGMMPDDPKAQQDLAEMVQSFAHIHTELAGAKSEAGRLLNSFGMGFDEMLNPLSRAGGEAGEALGRRLPRNMTAAERRQLVLQLRLTHGDPQQILDVMMHTADVARRSADDPSRWDKILGFRTNMLLSGPKTFMINAINNLVTAYQVPLEKWYAGVRTGNTELARQGLDMLPKMADVKDALDMSRRSWREGVNILDPLHKIDDAGLTQAGMFDWMGSAGKVLNNISQTPGRALMAGDEFFKQLTYRSNVRSQALRVAREDIDKGALKALNKGRDKPLTESQYLASKVHEALQDAFSPGTKLDGELVGKGSAVNKLAISHSRYSSFTNDLEYGIGKSLRDMSNKHPFIRMILPFVRTPVNLVRFAHQRTPGLNRWQKQLQDDLAAGGERAAYAKARQEVGIGLYGTGAMLALSGAITGSGPDDPQLRSQWLEYNDPYSIQLPGGVSIKYQRLEPLATPLALIADGVEAWGELGEEDGENMAYATIAALSSSISSKTFLFGLSDFMSAVSDGETYAVRQYVQNLATSFSPNFINQMNSDPVYRESRSLVDAFRRRAPGFSHGMEARRNLFGEKVLKAPVYFNRAMNPFTVMAEPEDADVWREITEVGEALSMPNRTRMEGAIDLADRQKFDNGTGQSPYDRMFEIVSNPGWGPSLKEAMTDLVQSDMWDQLGSGNEVFGGGGKKDKANQLVRGYYRRAYTQVLQEYPKLRREVELMSEKKVEGYLATSSINADTEMFGG